MKHFSKLIAALFISILCSSFSFADDAIIMSVIGTVEIGKEGNWKPASKGSIVKEGDLISTGFKSEALIRFNGSTMKLGSLTQVTLEQLASNQNKDSVSVYLKTGSVRSTVTHTSNKKVSYTVRNPVAVASVRGTDFTFRSDGLIRCHKGAVVVYPAHLFNAALHGIKNPADGQKGATPEQVVNAESTMPADGESNELTNKGDVAPNTPNGGILLTAGHSTDFSGWNTNQPTEPKDSNQENADNLSSGFETPSSGTQEDAKKQKSKATLNITIGIEE